MHSNPKLKAVDLGGISRGMFRGKSENFQIAINEISSWLEPQRVRSKSPVHPSDHRPDHRPTNAPSALDSFSKSDVDDTARAPKD
jgi:hypothetical protein